MGRIIKPGNAPVRAGIYANPKDGKTRLATSLPWGPRWGEKAVYVAWDPGSEDLSSVLPANLERLIPWKPTSKELPGGKMVFDPYMEAVEAAQKDWKKEDPDIGTIIWDTMTSTARDLLGAVATLGLWSGTGKQLKIGDLALPTMGDYGGAQRCVHQILNFLFNQPLNVLVLFHTELADSENGGIDTLVGGPATVGRAAIQSVGSVFDNLFRLSVEKERVPQTMPPKYTSRRVLHTEKHGPWLGGIRSHHTNNPMSEVEIKEDPSDFWRKFDELKGVK